eukprot:660177-Pyramimonas_sp.AAC.1
MGKRLARKTRRQRAVKGDTQNQKLRKYAHAARRYRVTKRVELAGPQAVSTYGMQVYGTFGTQLLTLRRRIGSVAGASKK